MVGYNASWPTAGGAAANVTIFFKEYHGTQIDPDVQSHVQGGIGGHGARGGEGKTLRCTCGGVLQAHSGSSSSDALDGKSGKVRLVPIGQHPAPKWAR